MHTEDCQNLKDMIAAAQDAPTYQNTKAMEYEKILMVQKLNHG